MLKSAVCFFLAVLSVSAAPSIYDYSLNSIDGKDTRLSTFKGKVVMLVNVASRCGYTPQYSGLESLYEKYRAKGFVIVGIPANNFMSQEPGANSEIQTFCRSKYNVQFPMMAKISVAGSDKAPLYRYLTSKEKNPKTGGEIQWNFTKFLVDREGKVVARFEPATEPSDPAVASAIDGALAKQ